MSEYYQLVEMDGKGFGYVASKDIKRGTLILREKAQMIYKTSKNWTSDLIKSMVTSFKQMSKSNQEEFLKLHNIFLNQDLWSDQKVTMYQIVTQMYESGHEREKILAILGICVANAYANGYDEFACVAIHASRFNHSCSPNITEYVTISGEIFVRTITKIKAGEEINCCYSEVNCIMKNRQDRQKYLKVHNNFICACNCCKDGKEDIKAIEAFEKFYEDAKRFQARIGGIVMTNKNPTEIILLLKKTIRCYKDMYNLGKKKKAAVSFLYDGVCWPWKIITINDHVYN